MKVLPYREELKAESKRMRERADCTVMAWAHCFDADYFSSWNWLDYHGRVPKRGMANFNIKQALTHTQKAKVKFGPYSRENRITLQKFCEKHPVGRYYVLVRGHAICVKDGIVYDHTVKPRRQVIFAARVYLEGEL